MPSAAAARARSALQNLVFVAFTLILAVAMQLRMVMGGRANGLPLDPDGWARMIRVRELWNGGGWYEAVLPHLSAPDGLSLHWTRPLDVLIVVPAWIALQFGADRNEALIWAGTLVCPVLHAMTALAAGWAARRAWPQFAYAAYYAVLVIFAYGVLGGYSVAGRADHHVLVVLAIVVGLGFAARATWPDAPRGAAQAAGVAFGFGVWVSPEALMVALPVLLALGIGWLLSRDGARWAVQGSRMALGLAAMVALAIAVERPPAEWLAVEYDKVSAHHLLMAALIAAVFAAAGRATHSGLARRFIAGAALSLLAGGFLVLVNPGTLGLSLSGADPASANLLLPVVQEMQPIRLVSRGGVAIALEFAGMAPAGLLAAAILMWQGRRDGSWVRGLMLLLAVMATLVATLSHRRFGTNLAGVGAVVAAGLMGMAARTAWPLALRVLLMLVVVVLLFGPPAIAPFLQQRTMDLGGVLAPRGCHAREVTNWLLELAQEGDRRSAPIVLTSDINQTAELAWRTHLRFVGAPYHRGGAAILDTLVFFGAEDEQTLQAVLGRRPVQYLLVCSDTFAGGGAFARRLLSDDLPDWVEAVPPPSGHEPGLARLFRLR